MNHNRKSIRTNFQLSIDVIWNSIDKRANQFKSFYQLLVISFHSTLNLRVSILIHPFS